MMKNKRSRITWITFFAFALAPIMGGVFIAILKNPVALSQAGMLKAKADAMGFDPHWKSYFAMLTQAVGVGGILVFGFVASWIFGREYSDGTSKDLLYLPTSRPSILNAKFLTYSLWCLALSLSNLLIGIVIGTLLNLTGWNEGFSADILILYLNTTVLTILVGTPVAFFAIAGEGYLAPLGFVALALVLAQIIAAAGVGTYFPWSIPGLYSGAAGEYRNNLGLLSYAMLCLCSLLGFLLTHVWWKRFDQSG